MNGEVTSIKVKSGSDAAKLLHDDGGNSATVIKKDFIGVYFGLTKNSNGYVTKLDTKTPSDVAINLDTTNPAKNTNTSYTEYTGVKRESNGGNVTFGNISMAANSKALIVYYDGEDLSIETRLVTDTKDKATVVTDDGDIIAICVRDMDKTGNLTHG